MTSTVKIRPDRDPEVKDRFTVLFFADPALETAIGTVEQFGAHQQNGVRAYSIPRTELANVIALPPFLDAEIDPRLQQAVLPGGILRVFQVEGLEYIEAHQGFAIVGDQRGVGKTAQALGWMYHHPDLLPVVVVCPANVKRQWARELCKWLGLPPNAVTIVKGRQGREFQTPYVVINYDILSYHVDGLTGRLHPRLVVFDEIQKTKNKGAARSKAAVKVAHYPSIRSRLGLTGTLFLNRPVEGWHQTHIIAPWAFPNEHAFRMRYGNPQRVNTTAKRDKDTKKIIYADSGEPVWNKSWKFEGASHLDELQDNLKRRVMIRRTKREVRPDSPDIQRVTVPMDCDLRDYLVLKEEKKQTLRGVRERLRNQRRYWEALTVGDMQRAVAKQAEKDSMAGLYGLMLTEITELKKAAGLAKVGPAVDWLTEFLEEETPVLLFLHHHEVSDPIVEQLNAKLKDEFEGIYRAPIPPSLDGRMSEPRRMREVDKFNQGDFPILAAGTLAMGEGFDGLQKRASHVAFAEFEWNQAAHDQAEGRLDREGQEEPVTSHYLMAVGTIDEDLANLIDSKGTVVSAAYGELPSPRILESLMEKIINAD